MAWTNILAFITNSPGASWGAAEAQEIVDNINFEIVGPYNLSGPTGTGITFTDVGSTDYFLSVMILDGSPAGNVGDITYTRSSGTAAIVHNTGSSTAEFYVKVEKIV